MRFRILAALLLVGCSGSSSSEESQPIAAPSPEETASPAEPTTRAPAATDDFWKAFLAGDLDAVPSIQQTLEAGDPNDPSTRLVLGMSYVWRNAENARAKEPLSPGEMFVNAQKTLEHLRALTELAPNEPRAWAHRGTATVTIGLATGNAAMVEEGRVMVESRTMPYDRAEAGFALGAAMSRAGAGTPELATAIDYLFTAYEYCLGRALDRDAPSFEGLDAARTSERPRDVCFDREHWPHAEEGNFLVLGDALEKAGKKDAARRAWEAARTVPTFASWKLSSVIDDRLAGKTHEEVGAAPYLCTQCHQR